MTQLQKIVAKAKTLKKSHPNTKWTDLIKKASKLVGTAKKSVGAVKKKSTVKKAVKKSTARSMHKDTKSHNVRINVVSGINKHLVERISKINDEIEQREDVIFDVMSRKKDLISRHGEGWYKKWIKDAKGIIAELKKHKTELKRFI